MACGLPLVGIALEIIDESTLGELRMSLAPIQNYKKLEEFETEVLKSNGLVVVGFWTDWSGSCHIMDPVIEEMLNTFSGR